LYRVQEIERTTITSTNTSDEIEAGIEAFKVFKQFNVLYAIAKTYIITPAQAFEMDYATALITLQRLSYESKFQKKLSKILEAKHKLKK
jgi:hypothetical protein